MCVTCQGRMLWWFEDTYAIFDVFLLRCGLYCSIYQAPPTAELEPLTEGKVAQLDEVSKVI